MKIPPETYLGDPNLVVFARHFDEPPGSDIIEAGSHDEPVAKILCDLGYDVTAVDLRNYDPPCDYKYMRADFCDLPRYFVRENYGGIDSIVSLSAIEHFGLGTYREGKAHPFYDLVACRMAWNLLKEGGTFYVTVPYGGKYFVGGTDWRVYDKAALQERIIQDFTVEAKEVLIVAGCSLGQYKDPLTWEEADSYSGDPPHIMAFLKLRKVGVNRLAPDGR